MKKTLGILVCITLALVLCFSTASAQLMKTEGAAGKVTRLYSAPAVDSTTVGYVANGTLMDIVSYSADRKWFQVEAEGELLWIPAAAVTAAQPSDLYWFDPLDDNLYLAVSGATDVYRSRIDPIATMLIQVIPDMKASDVITSFEERLPDGGRLELTMDGRTATGYTVNEGSVCMTFFAVDLNGEDALCFEMTGSADPDDETMGLFLSTAENIHLTDEIGELSRASRVWCPNCGEWFDSPDAYEAHACSGNLVRGSERTVNYVQCPDCGDWFEEGNIFRNHNCPARSNYVQCPDCGNWFEEGNIFRNHVCPAKDSNYVQCPDCGDWFEEGNIFRNHNCPARSNLVQCPDCGEWFEEGNIFRNHNCTARSNLVQCSDCGEWFEEGNIFRNHNCPAKESYTPNESGKVQCPDCYEWFETEELYLEHDCPEREEPKESFSQDSRAPEQPEEAVESYSQDPQAYDPYQDEPAESYSQDPQAYDSYQDEPIDNGSQDPDA